MIAILGTIMELALHATEVMFLIALVNVLLTQPLSLHQRIHSVKLGKKMSAQNAQIGHILIPMEFVSL